MKGFALRLVLKQRQKRVRKWPVESVVSSLLAPSVLLRVLRFFQHSKIQLDKDREPTLKPAKADVAYPLNIVN